MKAASFALQARHTSDWGISPAPAEECRERPAAERTESDEEREHAPAFHQGLLVLRLAGHCVGGHRGLEVAGHRAQTTCVHTRKRGGGKGNSSEREGRLLG